MFKEFLIFLEGETDCVYSEAKEHEAGYDSFITGVCFVALANYMKIGITELTPKNARIRKYLNK